MWIHEINVKKELIKFTEFITVKPVMSGQPFCQAILSWQDSVWDKQTPGDTLTPGD